MLVQFIQPRGLMGRLEKVICIGVCILRLHGCESWCVEIMKMLAVVARIGTAIAIHACTKKEERMLL